MGKKKSVCIIARYVLAQIIVLNAFKSKAII